MLKMKIKEFPSDSNSGQKALQCANEIINVFQPDDEE
jgi:hypothetical protein